MFITPHFWEVLWEYQVKRVKNDQNWQFLVQPKKFLETKKMLFCGKHVFTAVSSTAKHRIHPCPRGCFWDLKIAPKYPLGGGGGGGGG